MPKDFQSAIKNRRSYYGISNESKVSNQRIQEVIEEAVMHTPSAFNSQSARVMVLFGEHHKKLWNIVMEALRKIVPADKFKPTEDKVNSFANGYGTVLFFEDNSVISGLQEQYPIYKDNFPIWSQQSSGMLQYVTWTSLELEGFGVSLQHYNQLIENEVKKQWSISTEWGLICQMPFGLPTSEPDTKTYQPLCDRLKVFE